MGRKADQDTRPKTPKGFTMQTNDIAATHASDPARGELAATVAQLPDHARVQLLALYRITGYGEPATAEDRQRAAKTFLELRKTDRTEAARLWAQVRDARHHALYRRADHETRTLSLGVLKGEPDAKAKAVEAIRPTLKGINRELEAIRRANGYATLEQLAQWLGNPDVIYELGCSENRGNFKTHLAPTHAEDDLATWLTKGTTPTPFNGETPDTLLKWIDPKDGGGTLESLNAYRIAWWLSHQRLRARLLEFIALPIPRPREITQEDVETARREMETEGSNHG